MTATDEVKTPCSQEKLPLDLQDFLSGLLADGRIKQEDFDYVLNNRRSVEDRDKHIVQYIADLHIEDQKSPGRRLDIESLTMALSTQSGQEYYPNRSTKDRCCGSNPGDVLCLHSAAPYISCRGRVPQK